MAALTVTDINRPGFSKDRKNPLGQIRNTFLTIMGHYVSTKWLEGRFQANVGFLMNSGQNLNFGL